MKKLPTVALIGRVNVGKSTLFNKLVGERKALESPIAGTTRDYNQGIVQWRNATFSLIDTGGFLSERDEEEVALKTLQQAEEQAVQADVIVFVLSRLDELTQFDIELYNEIKKYNKPTIVAVNKVDKSREREEAILDVAAIGNDIIIPVSAITGEGTHEILDEILKHIPHIENASEIGDYILNPHIKLAIVGQPNVGKSSILNAICGEERAIVSEIAHTTRDAHDIVIEHKNHLVKIIDTAGIRRKKQKGDLIEKFSIDLSLKNLRRSNVALLVLDISKSISHQDKHLAEKIIDTGNSVIIIANKWDLIPDKETNTINEYENYIRKHLPFLDFAPIIFTSALTQQRITNILDVSLDVWEERFRRIDDNAMDKFIAKVIKKHRPARDKGVAHPYIYRMRQVKVNPPMFELTIKYQRSLHVSYVHFLQNQLRAQFGFHGTPIKTFITSIKGG